MTHRLILTRDGARRIKPDDCWARGFTPDEAAELCGCSVEKAIEDYKLIEARAQLYWDSIAKEQS